MLLAERLAEQIVLSVLALTVVSYTSNSPGSPDTPPVDAYQKHQQYVQKRQLFPTQKNEPRGEKAVEKTK